MAIGPDRVQVIKRESAALGGDAANDVEYYEPLEAQEDALEACGYYVQDAGARDENVYMAREGNNLIFRDVNNTSPVTLSSLTGFRRSFLFMGG